jgi:hypothetical protein
LTGAGPTDAERQRAREIEQAARAYDPTGWQWYDGTAATTDEHTAKAREIFERDQITRMTAALASAREAATPAWRPIADDDHDLLQDALDDAISDGEGRIRVHYVEHHLTKHGFKIVVEKK